MQKQADSKIDPATVGRFALGGAITGGSTMSLINLVRMLKSQYKERKALIHTPETDEDTIVLTIPNKTAALIKSSVIKHTGSGYTLYNHTGKKVIGHHPSKAKALAQERAIQAHKHAEVSGATMIKNVTTPKASTSIGPKTTSQYRRGGDGTFGFKTASNWQTLTAATLATMGSAVTGSYVVNRIYQMQKEKILKDKVDAARKDYLAMLDQGKTASVLDNMFKPFGEKQADGAFGMLNYPMAAAALLSILGAGGVGYVTKKILDEQLQTNQNKGLDLPHVKRIVFKTAPAPVVKSKGSPHVEDPTIQETADTDTNKSRAVEKTSEEVVTPEEIDCIKAAFCVHLDMLDSTTKILNDNAVKQAMVDAKITTNKLFKMAAGQEPSSFDNLMGYMHGNPQLRQLIIRAAMDKHPLLRHLKFTSNLPGIRNIADNKVYSNLTSALGPKTAGEGKSLIPGLGLQSQVLGSLVGSTLAQKNESEQIAQDIIDAQQNVREEESFERKRNRKINPKDIDIEAADPNAQAYLSSHKEKVRALVAQLAAQGKL